MTALCMATPPGYQWLPPRCHKATGHEGEHATYGSGGFVEHWDDAAEPTTGPESVAHGAAAGPGAPQGAERATGATESRSGPENGAAA
jgi:hypothetical protein